ncbi:MAG: hypothetical protein DWQ29_12420 [Planctomycetota bacterium]|nr:MAG: hypothetical protein DWQ29_12420 [Planctomycetota bacterium]
MMSRFIVADGPGFQGFFADFNTTFWSGVLRMTEAMVAAAPFLLAGLFVAGALRGMVGPERIRRLLGVGEWSGPLRAWGLGVLLPICSLGALPVARELRRAGVPSGTVLSFVLVAPVLNPVSVIYGLSHIVPATLLYFAAGTFAVSVGIGVIWNRLVSSKRDTDGGVQEAPPHSGVGRLAVAGHTAARSLVGPVFVDYALALLTVGLLGALLPHGVLQTGMTRDNFLAPVIMGLVAIPAYVTPTNVMMHFGHIVQDGYSLGAAFSLIVLGAGANVGVANWLRRDYGGKPLMLFVGLLLASTIVIGVTADRTIVHGNSDMKDHTHAFDPFTRVAGVATSDANLAWVWTQIERQMHMHEAVGAVLLALMAVAGIVLWLLRDRVGVEHLMRDPNDVPEPAPSSVWNPVLSFRQLVAAGVFSVAGLAMCGLYVFYPSAENLISDMNDIRVDAYDAVKAEDAQESQRRLAQWRNLAQKLPTSVLIRRGSVTKEEREQVDELLYGIDVLEDYAATDRFTEARAMISFVERVYSDCRREINTQRAPKPFAAAAE